MAADDGSHACAGHRMDVYLLTCDTPRLIVGTYLRPIPHLYNNIGAYNNNSGIILYITSGNL